MCSNKVGFKIVKARAINQGVEGVKTITGRAPWEPTHAGSGKRVIDTNVKMQVSRGLGGYLN